MIEAYLERLGARRPDRPDARALASLQVAHQRAIPFENIDVWSGVPLDLDPDALFDKIVRRGRGGFCYELNSLFARLLEELGFDVRMMSAGVVDAAGVVGPPFDHMCLRVEFEDGSWLSDVGFGRAPLHPIRLAACERIEDPAAAFRLRRLVDESGGFDSGSWAFDREAPRDPRSGPDGWMPLYVFDSRDRGLEDFAAMCAWHQSSRDSIFPRTLILSRATESGRVSVRGMDWIRETRTLREKGMFANRGERDAFVLSEFGMEVPERDG